MGVNKRLIHFLIFLRCNVVYVFFKTKHKKEDCFTTQEQMCPPPLNFALDFRVYLGFVCGAVILAILFGNFIDSESPSFSLQYWSTTSTLSFPDLFIVY